MKSDEKRKKKEEKGRKRKKKEEKENIIIDIQDRKEDPRHLYIYMCVYTRTCLHVHLHNLS